jgi:hypothetical protein
MSAVAVGAIFFAILLAITAAMLWQSRGARTPEQAEYLVGEAIAFVHGGLPEEAAASLTTDDVRSLLDWSRHHSQVVVARSGAEVPVLGGPEAVAYVAEQSIARGRPIDEALVRLILDLEAAYLVTIGAIGEPVEEAGS